MEQMLRGRVGLNRLRNTQLQGIVNDLPTRQVIPVNQGHGGTLIAGTTGTAGTVQVGLLILGHAVVNHVGHVFNVNTASCHVGSDQNVDLAGAERLQRLLTRNLVQVTVQGSGSEATVHQLLRHAGSVTLGLGEDDGAAAAGSAQNAANHLVLVQVVRTVDDLADRRLSLRGVLGVSGANAHGLGHVLACHRNDRAGHGCGEQHALAVLRQVAEDLLNRRLETQIQHLVSLIEDHNLNLLQVQEALLVQVDNAAGGAHRNLQAAAQQLSLRLNRHTTVQGGDAGVAQLRSNRQVLAHLNSKLTGRNQNQRLRCAGVLQISPTLIVAADHTLNGGQTEAEGLTGTGLRLTNDVLARQSHGKSQLLDGEGGGNANRREGVANILANAEVGEGLCSLSGFLRVRFSHWTVSFYPCSGCVSPRNGGCTSQHLGSGGGDGRASKAGRGKFLHGKFLPRRRLHAWLLLMVHS